MLALLLTVAWWAPPLGGWQVPPPPAEPAFLRTVVWPVLEQAAGARAVTAVDLEAGAGLLWATQPTPGSVQLHRVIFATRREAVAELDVPANEPPAVVAETLRLKLAWLLEASPEAGTPWTPPAPPLPARLPPERADDLRTLRPATPPLRRTVVPLPPGASEVDSDGADREVEAGEVVPEVGSERLRLRLGVEGLAQLDDLSPGVVVAAEVLVAPPWRLGVVLGGHPFHDYRRGGRAQGVTSMVALVRLGRVLWSNETMALEATGGAFVGALSGVGAGVTTEDPRVGAAVGGGGEVLLGGPLRLVVELDALWAPWASRARFGHDVLLTHGPLELRGAVLLGWAL